MKKVYFSQGIKTKFQGGKSTKSFKEYLQELSPRLPLSFDEGIIASFMSGQFINQGNLGSFLPMICPSLHFKPCSAVEGACGSGGRALSMAIRSILSGISDSTLVVGIEIQNTMKPLYTADVLAGAADYSAQRKEGAPFFFPNLFSERAKAYFDTYGEKRAREAMSFWVQSMMNHAKLDPYAHEYGNTYVDLNTKLNLPPDPLFLPYLHSLDCSKVSDGAVAIGVFSEEGLKKNHIEKKDAIELFSIGESTRDITKKPIREFFLETTQDAAQKAFKNASLSPQDLSLMEIHDCFSISALLMLEAIGIIPEGKAPEFILGGNTLKEGILPVNLSGGLIGFGHPTGATGVRQMVDLWEQQVGKALNQASLKSPYAMMTSMGGDDVTLSCIITKTTAR